MRASTTSARRRVPLGFDPSGPLVVPSLVVTPSTALPFRTTVHATGADFPSTGVGPGIGFVELVQCKAGALSYEDCRAAGGQGALLDASGGSRRRHRAPVHPPARRHPVRLRVGARRVRAGRAAVLGRTRDRGARLRPRGADPAPSCDHARANGPLPYRTTLTVTGTGFPPNTPVQLSQCEAGMLFCFGFGLGGFALTGERLLHRARQRRSLAAGRSRRSRRRPSIAGWRRGRAKCRRERSTTRTRSRWHRWSSIPPHRSPR